MEAILGERDSPDDLATALLTRPAASFVRGQRPDKVVDFRDQPLLLGLAVRRQDEESTAVRVVPPASCRRSRLTVLRVVPPPATSSLRRGQTSATALVRLRHARHDGGGALPAHSNLKRNTEAWSEDLDRRSITKALAGAVVQEILGFV